MRSLETRELLCIVVKVAVKFAYPDPGDTDEFTSAGCQTFNIRQVHKTSMLQCKSELHDIWRMLQQTLAVMVPFIHSRFYRNTRLKNCTAGKKGKVLQ